MGEPGPQAYGGRMGNRSRPRYKTGLNHCQLCGMLLSAAILAFLAVL